MNGGRVPRVLAPLLDAVALAVFVAAGRESHDIGGGPSWYFTVLWPFAAGWFATALADGMYVARSRLAVRVGVTLVLGIAIALVLRSVITHRATPVAFAVVAYVFIAVFTVGWRLVGLGLRTVLRRRRTDASNA